MKTDEAVPRRTRRQEVAELLTGRPWSFEELRAALAVSVHTLEDDLQHLERSLRRGDRRLAVTACRCSGCGYEFRGRAPRRFRTPGRCPRCRGEHIRDAQLAVVEQ
jgi:predicted Zn-ribbon and HTH transcriptional regulator